MLGKNLKNGIHQWCVGKLVEVLITSPYTLLSGQRHTPHREIHLAVRLLRDIPLCDSLCAERGRRVKVIKIQMRLARLSNGLVVDRDVIGAINIGLKYLQPDGRGVAFPSTEPHEVRVKP